MTATLKFSLIILSLYSLVLLSVNGSMSHINYILLLANLALVLYSRWAMRADLPSRGRSAVPQPQPIKVRVQPQKQLF